LLIRNIEEGLKERLRMRARRRGRSMAAELREILCYALRDEPPQSGLGTKIAARFKGIGLREGEEIPELRGFTIQNPFED
jgi:plasmid stability protein